VFLLKKDAVSRHDSFIERKPRRSRVIANSVVDLSSCPVLLTQHLSG